jgi:hypothetical protein
VNRLGCHERGHPSHPVPRDALKTLLLGSTLLITGCAAVMISLETA